MSADALVLTLLPTPFAVCKIGPDALIEGDDAATTASAAAVRSYLADLFAAATLPPAVSRRDGGSGSSSSRPMISITRTDDEISIVAPTDLALSSAGAPGAASWLTVESGWRMYRVEGPLPFAMTGVMSRLAGALADARVSLFAVSTYDTDYVAVKAENVEAATRAFVERAGCRVVVAPGAAGG
ncbi:ACT domain-containing protein [Zopfochytrium polystomum]|nr:ACT domain-containing protein [Zopfochytrium polystomum]